MGVPQNQPPSPGRKSTDRGLSGLGLIMQLVGGVMTAVAAGYGMMMIMMMLQAGRRGGGGMITVWLLAIVASSVARSVMHANAGKRLVYDGPGTPLSALNRYIVTAFIQTGIIAAAILVNEGPPKVMLGIVLLLAAWPVALLILAKPEIEKFGGEVPMADDKGFDGAAILLLIFGAIGIGISSIFLLAWFEIPGPAKSSLFGMGMLASGVMLTIRSVFHIRAGVRGTSATHMAETAEAAEKYGNFGVLAALVTGGAMFLGFLVEMPKGAPGSIMVMFLMMVGMLVWMLLIWPVTVRKFFSDRQFATLMDQNAPTKQQSPDRGLPTLGWLLLALGVFGLASGLFSVLADLNEGRGMRRMGRGGDPFEMFGMMGSAGGKSPWFNIGVAAVQVWAGFELIRMTARYKMAAIAYGAVATGVALYIYLPLLGDLMSGGAAMLSNPLLLSMLFLSVAMALVVPVATLIFAQRKTRDAQKIAQTFE
jgi:hypothetical protein